MSNNKTLQKQQKPDEQTTGRSLTYMHEDLLYTLDTCSLVWSNILCCFVWLLMLQYNKYTHLTKYSCKVQAHDLSVVCTSTCKWRSKTFCYVGNNHNPPSIWPPQRKFHLLSLFFFIPQHSFLGNSETVLGGIKINLMKIMNSRGDNSCDVPVYH